MRLVDKATAALLSSVRYAASHGAAGTNLGAGMLYYALACTVRARLCVCLGSGGGFVPCLMRQAQRDMELEFAETYLVDAILPEAGYGSPELPGGWTDPGSVLRQSYPEITVLNCLTQDAASGFFSKNRSAIDFLHIDADHSYAAVMEDFRRFKPLLDARAFVTLHDTNTDGVRQAVRDIAEEFPEFQRFVIPDVGPGIAILRPVIAPV